MGVTNLLVALGFTFIHLGSKHFRVYKIPVSQFTSFVGGISLAYVFFYLLPTLSTYEHEIAEMFHLSSSSTYSAYHIIFGSVLAGLVVFYFLEQALRAAKFNVSTGENDLSTGVFWTHIGSYFIYNLIIGILLSEHRFETRLTALFYLVTIGLHFLTNDWILRHHFEKQFDKYGRNLLCAAVLIGWGLGIFLPLHHAIIGLLEAFVVGGIILNAIKDELPECKGRGFVPFIVGVAFYSVMLFAL